MYKRAAWLPIALYCGLSACSGRDSSESVASPDLSTERNAGLRIYNGSCAACHQQDARGVPGVYPSLVSSRVLLGDPVALTLWVLKGIRPALMPPGRYPTRMPQFGWMSLDDAALLFTFLRTHFGNTAPGIDPSMIARALED